MSEAWGCMSAYQKLTDGVLDYIMMSNEKISLTNSTYSQNLVINGVYPKHEHGYV
jgi:hypothetical protein